MQRAARFTAFALGGLFFVPYTTSFLKLFAGLLVSTLGLVAIGAARNDEPGRARSNLIAAFGLIVLIEVFAPLDWRALIRWMGV